MRRVTHILPLLLVLAILLWPPLTLSQTDSAIQTGKVIESVVIKNHTDQSYAVFLPSNYTTEKSWPTVFCLDPRGRGKVAIDRFVSAAEKYGYVVFCSNNSRNGLNWSTIGDIFSNFWDDAHARFNIDEKRTYAAGFSGGSRLASTFASRCRGCLAGVIGSGAGYPGDILPDAKTPFAYFGIIGVDDFNFGEMWQLEKKLSKLEAPYHFENFSGGHEWAPKENIDNALAWLILQAMKSGSTPVDQKFVEDQFQRRVASAEQQLTNENAVDAYNSLASIFRDFQDLRDVKSLALRADQINKSEAFKKEARAEEDLYQKQLREAGEIRMLWTKAPDPEETGTGRFDAMARLSEWKKKKELPNDTRDRRLARRIISHLLIESYETSQSSLRNNDFTAALANYQLVKEIDPKNSNIYYEIARVQALKRQKKAALEALEQAVSLGFKDLERVKAEDAFSTLATEPRFQKLLSTISGQ